MATSCAWAPSRSEAGPWSIGGCVARSSHLSLVSGSSFIRVAQEPAARQPTLPHDHSLWTRAGGRNSVTISFLNRVRRTAGGGEII